MRPKSPLTTRASSLDRLPPHDPEAEAGALACVLSADNGDAAPMLAGLSLDCFYDERHRLIYSKLAKLGRDGKPLDVVSLAQAVRDSGETEKIGGLEYLTALPDRTPSPANFPAFQDAVEGYRVRRVAICDAVEVQRLALDTTLAPAAVADAARRMLEATSQLSSNRDGLTIHTPDELLAMRFDDSDRILGDRLMALAQSFSIAGAGSIGKTRLLLQLAVAVITGRPFLGLETHREDLNWLVLGPENSNRRLQMDFAALRKWVGPEDWAKVNRQLCIQTLETDADAFLSLDSSRTQERIADAIRVADPGVVAFDSLYNFGIGDLNRDEDMAATLLTLSRLTRAGNPERVPLVLHHALTGKAGAARATGYDRASFGRNSKVLHSWTRGQLNVAPGSPDSNDTLVLSCGKVSNGKEFSPFAVRLNPDTMIYEPATDFDLAGWQSDVTGKRTQAPTITPERVRELCKGSMAKKDLARAIIEDAGCARSYAYRMLEKAERARLIHFTKATEKYVAKL
ncbi:MAG: AAA family ATPase [Verrucomicrobia bacterium]|nr:AAA family ATPase [Verrucomicrobiota bacterium]